MRGISASSEGVLWFTATVGNIIYGKCWYVCMLDMYSGEKYNVLLFSNGGVHCSKDSGDFHSQKLQSVAGCSISCCVHHKCCTDCG
jgi:roadblock/LC7 domain-containing protein